VGGYLQRLGRGPQRVVPAPAVAEAGAKE